jgi:chromate reductase
VVPAEVELYEVPIRDLPLYDEDLGTPPVVEHFLTALRGADGILFVSPEYNYSVPGVLKNAVDWASRDPEKASLHRKPAAMMGASSGLFGTVRGQLHLRHVLMFLDMDVVSKPEVHIIEAPLKFDESGTLTDDQAKNLVAGLLEALAAKVRNQRAVASLT